MDIKLDEKAIKELKRVKEDQKLPDDVVVRVGIAGGGCSGFQYNLQFDERPNYDEKNDHLLELDGIDIVVDKKSMLYIDGTTVGYHEDLNQRGFTFSNPNASKTCGCGTSFQV